MLRACSLARLPACLPACVLAHTLLALLALFAQHLPLQAGVVLACAPVSFASRKDTPQEIRLVFSPLPGRMT